jgi:hypothetical protein
MLHTLRNALAALFPTASGHTCGNAAVGSVASHPQFDRVGPLFGSLNSNLR